MYAMYARDNDNVSQYHNLEKLSRSNIDCETLFLLVVAVILKALICVENGLNPFINLSYIVRILRNQSKVNVG